MKKESTSLRNLGIYTNPATPDYRDNNVGGILKGWSSERVPLPINSSRRHISAAALMPFNSGRTLPSKWDDAERWITSPVSGYGVFKASTTQPQRRPKSKSGPLGTPGVTDFSNYSPAAPMLEGGNVKNFMVGSPFTTGVLVPDGLSIHYGSGVGAQCNPLYVENNIARSRTVPGWSDLLNEASLPSIQDEMVDGTNNAETMVSRVVSRRDMATQMSPEGSTHSSAKGRSSFSTSPPSTRPLVELHYNHSAKVEVRDVEVDKGANVIKQSKKHGARMTKKGSSDVKDLTSSWGIAEAATNTSKLQREESKITAWENLQKAKAEAAIRKLEVELEKKRSVSMDKILNKLSVAQKRAQEKRNLMSGSHDREVSRISLKLTFFRKYVKIDSIRCCFTCRAL